MKKFPAAPLAVPLLASMLAASMLLTGCGEDTKPSASPSSTTASSSPTTPGTPTPTETAASPTATAGPKTVPNIPAAARAHTPAGAEAFVRYFYTQVNIAWTKPDSGLIAALSSKGCKSCAALEATATDLARKGHRYDGPPTTVVSVDSLGEGNSGNPEVLVRLTQEHRNVIDRTGQVVLTDQQKAGNFVATARWSGRGWLVASVESLA